MDSRRQPGRERQLAPTNGVAVLIVHPDHEFRRAVRAVVNAAPGFDPAGDAATAEEALEPAQRAPLLLRSSVETRWRVTPKCSAICSIVRPSS